MSSDDHRAGNVASVRVAVLTVSDTRTAENDHSGAAIHRMVSDAGHCTGNYKIVLDEPDVVRQYILKACAKCDVDTVLINGGTGLAPRDTTIEAVAALFEKHIDGFGELFRMLSFAEIGADAMLTRAAAGTRGNTAIFCMPGSTPAVTLAMQKLILPTLPHLVSLLRSATVVGDRDDAPPVTQGS